MRTFALLERFFRFSENGTNLRTEMVAGTTTFMTMAYIIFVQPAVLSLAGMDTGAVMVATCLSSALGSLLMGLMANYPVALAPALGENFFFVYTVVLGMQIGWQKALGAVFISGVLFFILTLFKIREGILNAVPPALKGGIAVGIGLFITFIGLNQAGLVQKSAGGVVEIGNLRCGPVLLALAALLVTAWFTIRKVKGAILWGMVVSSLGAFGLGWLSLPSSPVSLPPSLKPTLFRLDIPGALSLGLGTVVFVFLFMDLFDTLGTLIGVGDAAGMLDEKGRLPRATSALMADSIATVGGALLGTSTVSSYVESATGVNEGGRTGMTAVVTAFWFLVALFFSPWVSLIGKGIMVNGTLLHPITSPALIMVGALMVKSITRVPWDDLTESFPAFLTMVGMPFTYSIADGLALGFISYPVLKLLSGRGREVSWLMYTLGALFVMRYLFFSAA